MSSSSLLGRPCGCERRLSDSVGDRDELPQRGAFANDLRVRHHVARAGRRLGDFGEEADAAGFVEQPALTQRLGQRHRVERFVRVREARHRFEDDLMLRAVEVATRSTRRRRSATRRCSASGRRAPIARLRRNAAELSAARWRTDAPTPDRRRTRCLRIGGGIRHSGAVFVEG